MSELNVPVPQGTYQPALLQSGFAYSAGMTPRRSGELIIRGLLGTEINLSDGRAAAALASTNALAAIAETAGGLEQIEHCLRMTVYLAAAPGFVRHSEVADAATKVLHDWLGERGTVVRSAIGVASLPSGAPVEVELTAGVRR